MKNEPPKQPQTNQPLNLYGILDNEMARMHALLQTFLTLPQQDNYGHRNYGGLSSSSSFSSHSGGIPEIYKRIIKIQDIMLTALASHDKNIQEKVAELALTGVPDDET